MDGFLLQAGCNISYGILVGGVFLSGYLIYLGLPDQLLSYLSSAQMICGAFTVLVVPWLDKKHHRRRLMITLCLISRFFQLSIILSPWFLPGGARPYVVALCLFLGSSVAAVNDIVFNTWFAAVIPDAVKGRYYALRQRVGVVTSLSVTLLASAVMDYFQQTPYPVFAAAYGIALLVTLLEVRALRTVEDVNLEPNAKKLPLWDVVRIPTANTGFRWYMLYCCLLYLFWFLSTTFNSVFQLKYLQMSYTYINAIGAVRYLLQLLIFYKVWGLICDKVGNSFALFCSVLFHISDCLLWAMLDQNTVWFVFPVINILGAVGQTGFAIALFNRRYELIPPKGKVIYETFFSASIGLTVMVSPFLGGQLRSFFGRTSLAEIPFGPIRAVYLVSAFLIALLEIAYALYLSRRFPDKKIVSSKNFRMCFTLFKNVITRKS